MRPAPSSDERGNALWGRGGRNSGRLAQRRAGGVVVLLALVTAMAIPAAGVAAPGGSSLPGTDSAVVPTALLAQAQTNPSATFKVIVQGKKGSKSADIASEVTNEKGKAHKAFSSISGVAATISGKDLLKLAKHDRILAITADEPVRTTAYENAEMWRQTTDVANLANTIDPYTGVILGPAPQAPAVA